MKIIRKIALTELQSLFFSPVAWFILIVFTVQSALSFMDVLGTYVRMQEMNYNLSNLTPKLFGAGSKTLFTQVLGYLYLYIPLLTMGLMSRELSSGSIKLLYSSPVRNSQIILGKFLSMMIFGLVLVAIQCVFVIYAAFTVKNLDFTMVLSGLLGIYLLICAYSAIGLFMSSLTSYQVVAGIGTLVILAALNYISRFGQGIDVIRDITYWLNIGGRAQGFIAGLVSSEDVLYFILIICMFLSLSILRMKAIRQKAKGVTVWAKYAAVVVIVLGLGYLTSRPATKFYYDSTRTKQLTLTKHSQEIIRMAEGPLTITTYVNAFDPHRYYGLPKGRIADRRHFDQYLRFKPEIRLKYVYYYSRSDESAQLERRFPDMTDEQILGRLAISEGFDSTMFKPVSTFTPEEQEMLKDEKHRFFRVLERADGQRSFLRVYDDFTRWPSEREITASLKRIVMQLPVVGFVTGHGERSIEMVGDRGYFRFARQNIFRNSLINQGFEVERVSLDNPVPEHIDIITISDMREPLTPEQEANLDAYIARGGNMVIAGEINRQPVMNPLVERFGVRFLPGQVVRRTGAGSEAEKYANSELYKSMQKLGLENNPPDDYLPDFIAANLTEEGARLNYMFGTMFDRGNVVAMQGCVGLEYNTGSGYDVIQLLMSDDKDSWNELETTEFVDNIPVINTSIGEKEESLPLGLALTRDVKGKEQRILILGDSDCISNGEISKYRPKIPASNYDLIMSTFYWLSYDEVPIDVRRPSPTDNRLYQNNKQYKAGRFWIVVAFPVLLLGLSLFLWLRRRGR